MTNFATDDGPLIFIMKVHHNGSFTPPPGRSYVNGMEIFVDLVDGQCICLEHMHQLMAQLGYDEHERAGMKMFFKPPEADLDTGLKELVDDHSVWDITNYFQCEPIPLEVYLERDGAHIPSGEAERSLTIN